MNPQRSLRLLHVVLAMVLFVYAVQLVIAPLSAAHRMQAFVFLLTLGIVEAVGAVAFVFAVRAGGITLLIAIAVAALFHLLHGEADGIGALAIYAAGVLAVMSNTRAATSPIVGKRRSL